MAWLLALPGAPLLYYGDEYGQWGGADPNNRLMWRSAASLNADEAATLALVKKLGAARRAIPALRRGTYSPLSVNEDTLVFARFVSAGQVAIVALTRAGSPQAVTVDAGKLGVAPGTAMHDAIGGPDATVAAGGQLSFTIPAGGVVILAP
jgi:glycosidase